MSMLNEMSLRGMLARLAIVAALAVVAVATAHSDTDSAAEAAVHAKTLDPHH